MKNIEKILIINLKRRMDRKIYMTELLREFNDGINYEFFEATDGQNIRNQYLEEHNYKIYPWSISAYNGISPNDYQLLMLLAQYYNRDISPGEIGCSLSHYRIWQKVVDEKLDEVLILEDDVKLKINAAEIMNYISILKSELNNIDSSWEFIYLGRKSLYNTYKNKIPENLVLSNDLINILTDKPTKIPGIVKPGYSWLSHAYILTYQGACKLLNAHFKNNIIPLDEYLPAMYSAHPREDIAQCFRHVDKINAYAFGNIIMQNDSISDIEDVKAMSEI